MSLAVLFSRAGRGVSAPLVSVEVHLANGLPALNMVGLPEAAVRESKDRVRAAILNSRFDFPVRRVTINLAPADLPKEGGRFDLAIALGILAASGQLPADRLSAFEFLGELALSGGLRPVRGVLPAALAARDAGRALVLPRENADEACLVSGLDLHPADSLLEVCQDLVRTESRHPCPRCIQPVPRESGPDLADVRGQPRAKRAIEIAAAGGHSILMLGPPGSGKSMLASRLPGVLPAMTEREALESAAIQSVSHGGFRADRWRTRPFRAPHHTASGAALVGGGSVPAPGEISLAHHGVLFLDELPEFDRRVLEVLREPLETGCIVISRAARQETFPAQFQLVAAMNPCPCGYLGDEGSECRCTEEQVARYRGKISGPLLDRFDIQIEVPRVPVGRLSGDGVASEEASRVVAGRVERARTLQIERGGCVNSRLDNARTEAFCALDPAARALLDRAMERLRLSARGYYRILRLARTIADLASVTRVGSGHLAEAIGYRQLERRC